MCGMSRMCIFVPMRDRDAQLEKLLPRLRRHLVDVDGFAPDELLFMVSTQVPSSLHMATESWLARRRPGCRTTRRSH